MEIEGRREGGRKGEKEVEELLSNGNLASTDFSHFTPFSSILFAKVRNVSSQITQFKT